MDVKHLNQDQRDLRRIILDISFQKSFCHLGSCFSAVDLIYAVYKVKREKDKFILSNGHSAVALYAVLKKLGLIQRSDISKLGVHPERNTKLGIELSTGSLGQGLPIALGMAFANRKMNVYCLVSDGETGAGSIWEALRVAQEYKIDNLKVLINVNRWGAYGPISAQRLLKRLYAFKVFQVDGHNYNKLSNLLRTKITGCPILFFAKTTVEQLPFLTGQNAHYYIMNKKDYNLALKLLK